MDSMLLIAQLVGTSLITLWLTIGVLDNLRHPSVNETITAEVLSMVRMAEEFPDAFARFSSRAITSRSVQNLAFRLIVLGEACATFLLWVGLVALIGACLGWVAPETARTTALLGATAFTGVWGMFLIVGNYFCYWLCHDGAQNTHYQMTLWGLGTMVLIAI
ncbi:MAG: DUF2165 family protein [Paracoccaceae bacterium]